MRLKFHCPNFNIIIHLHFFLPACRFHPLAMAAMFLHPCRGMARIARVNLAQLSTLAPVVTGSRVSRPSLIELIKSTLASKLTPNSKLWNCKEICYFCDFVLVGTRCNSELLKFFLKREWLGTAGKWIFDFRWFSWISGGRWAERRGKDGGDVDEGVCTRNGSISLWLNCKPWNSLAEVNGTLCG